MTNFDRIIQIIKRGGVEAESMLGESYLFGDQDGGRYVTRVFREISRGIKSYRAQDYEKAMFHLSKAASLGDSLAMYRIGEVYLTISDSIHIFFRNKIMMNFRN